MTMYRSQVIDSQLLALSTYGTTSGSICTFNTDLPNNLVKLLVSVEAVGGGGTPSAPNPIQGWSACDLVSCGKNVLPKLFITTTSSNVTLTANSDGTLSFSGIASGLDYFIKTFNLKKGSYIFTSGVDESFDTYDTYISKDGTTIARGGNNMSPNSFTLTEDSTLSIAVRVRQGANTDGLKIYPMIRLSSDSDTTYAEYNGTTHIIDWGINQWDETWEVGSLDSNGQNTSSTTRIRTVGYIPVTPGASYYVKASSNIWIWGYDSSKTYTTRIPDTSAISNRVITIPSGVYYIRFVAVDAYGTTYNHDISINFPATYTGYYKYVTGQQVYGASLDPLSGVLSITHGYVVKNGTETWSIDSQRLAQYAAGLPGVNPPATNGTVANILCNKYPAKTANQVYSHTTGISVQATQGYLYIYDPDYTTEDDLTAWKAALAAEPMTIAYELETPIEIQLDSKQIQTIANFVNNIYSDTGDIIDLKFVLSVGQAIS